MHRALFEAGPAARAAVVVELVAVSDAKLYHRVLGAGAKAAITLNLNPPRGWVGPVETVAVGRAWVIEVVGEVEGV
jgi:hypothetical protein